MDLRPIYSIMGTVLSVLAVAMALPALADAHYGDQDWRVFASAGVVTLYFGAGLWFIGRRKDESDFTIRQALLLVTVIWLIVPAVGAMPLVMGSLRLPFTDAYFEAVSGMTTTGSTILVGIESLPPGVLLWRGMMQWFGGLGVIVMAISLLPMLELGGMQMFRVEAFETFGKASPRMRQVSGGITVVFILLTTLLFLGLMAAGMNSLDAIVHAMTTIATGGYSNYDASVGHFDSVPIEVMITIGMICGGIPFILYAKAIRGDWRSLLSDEQVGLYLRILALSILIVTLWLSLGLGVGIGQALRDASFTMASIMTGTGYVTTDYGTWGGFPVIIILSLTFLGGCAGSTACGMKVFRLQILGKAVAAQIRQIVYPNGVFRPTFNNHPFDAPLVVSVASVVFSFILGFILVSLGLTLTGLDAETAFSSAATAVSNVGPGLGEIVGPVGNFAPLSKTAKWILIAGMLFGRLEFLTFLALFNPLFWKR